MPCRCRPRCASPSRRDRCRWGVVAGDEVLVGGGSGGPARRSTSSPPAPGAPPASAPAAAPRVAAAPGTPRWTDATRVRARRPTSGWLADGIRPLPRPRVPRWSPGSHLGTRLGDAVAGLVGAGPGSRRRATTPSPAPCSSPTPSAPARRSPTPCAPASAPPPRSPPPCSTPPPTATPRATVVTLVDAAVGDDPRCRGARPPGRARHRPHLGRRPRHRHPRGLGARWRVAAHIGGTGRNGVPHDDARRAAPRRLPRLGEPDAGLAGGRRHRRASPRPRSRWRPSSTSTCCAAWGSTCPPRPGPTTSSWPCVPTTPTGWMPGWPRSPTPSRGCGARATRSGGDDEVAPRTLGSAAARCRRDPGGHLGARPARRHRGLRRDRRRA